MRTALSISDHRLAPLFDVARRLLILDWSIGEELSRQALPAAATPLSTLAELKAMGVSQLVCGAVSRPLQHAAATLGLELYGFLTGEVEEVVAALLADGLPRSDLAMPGCGTRGLGCGRGRRCLHSGASRPKGVKS